MGTRSGDNLCHSFTICSHRTKAVKNIPIVDEIICVWKGNWWIIHWNLAHFLSTPTYFRSIANLNSTCHLLDVFFCLPFHQPHRTIINVHFYEHTFAPHTHTHTHIWVGCRVEWNHEKFKTEPTYYL